MDVTEIYCKADDFFKEFEPEFREELIEDGRKRNRYPELSISEIMTILILFHQSCYRHFKGYYKKHIQVHFQKYFPNLVSYNRFIQLVPRTIMPMMAFLDSIKGKVTGISFMDSTSIAVCKNKRIRRNKVFKDLATRGKTTMGWFFGFKLHLIVNDQGDLLSWRVTQGHVDDRAPVRSMAKNVKGKLFADKGYISQPLFKDLFEKGTHLVTTIRSNMKNRLMPIMDRILLRKRFIIETINDQLKNISQLEHSRHRSPVNFLVNLIAALSAYQLKPKKPAIKLDSDQLALAF
ncbi:MAG: IS982 family transposase [Lentisphaerae bacterium]|nr:IS982 family transposase [Lentisphaerota bacterium]